ncbi:MAG: hypothetical protein K2N41_00720 [Lachnospiraceae bacterium]|nr:hypothetical protein [Lachnospiraceae bacterium]
MGKKDGQKNEFWVEPLAGLGNRMQVLASAHFLAEKYHKRLCILWNNNSDLAADFEDIFETVPDAKVIPVTTDGYHTKPLLRMKSERLRKKLSSACSFVTEVDRWEGMTPKEIFQMVDEGCRNADDIYLKSWKPFTPVYEDGKITLEFLKPSGKVRQRGKDLFDRIGVDTVGVHIRRTDHVEAIADSPVAAFIEEMQKESERDGTCRFFVATDDSGVEQELFQRFGKRGFFKGNKSWGRDHADGILDACVDLWALSKCRKILGSKGSTFGMIAAKLGSKELKIVTKQ